MLTNNYKIYLKGEALNRFWNDYSRPNSNIPNIVTEYDNLPTVTLHDGTPGTLIRQIDFSWYFRAHQAGATNAPPYINSSIVDGSLQLNSLLNSQSRLIGVSFGTGTTPPSAEDYCLETPLNINRSAGNGTLNITSQVLVMSNPYMDDQDNVCVKMKFTITNQQLPEFSFTEMGFFLPYPIGNDASTVGKLILIDRQVFPAITLDAGDTVTFIYTLKSNYES